MSDENYLVMTDSIANQIGRAVKRGRVLAKGLLDGLEESSLSLLILCIALKSLHASICPSEEWESIWVLYCDMSYR